MLYLFYHGLTFLPICAIIKHEGFAFAFLLELTGDSLTMKYQPKIVYHEVRCNDDGKITIVKIKFKAEGVTTKSDNHAVAATVSSAFFQTVQTEPILPYRGLSITHNEKRLGIINLSFRLQEEHVLTQADVGNFILKLQKAIDQTSII